LRRVVLPAPASLWASPPLAPCHSAFVAPLGRDGRGGRRRSVRGAAWRWSRRVDGRPRGPAVARRPRPRADRGAGQAGRCGRRPSRAFARRWFASRRMLRPGRDGPSCLKRINGRTSRVYVLTPEILDGEPEFQTIDAEYYAPPEGWAEGTQRIRRLEAKGKVTRSIGEAGQQIGGWSRARPPSPRPNRLSRGSNACPTGA
jgi:hypothetical protein